MTPPPDPEQTGDGPRVSIVIPAYNRERYVGRALDGVLAQTMTQWEAVVFDDGSTDDTAAVAQQYADTDPRIRVVRGPNGGVAAARNRGWAATDSRSEFVIFLDSDDVWEPDTLETLIGALEADPAFVSAYGLARSMDPDGRDVPGDDLEQKMRRRLAFDGKRLLPVNLDQPTTFAALVQQNWPFTPGLNLVRRSVAEQVGPFDPKTDPADDWDFNLRLSRHGDIGFVQHRVLRWRRHGDTLTETSPRWSRAYFSVRRKTITDPANTPEQAQLAGVAYRHDAHVVLGIARERLATRDFTGALRPAAQAAQRYLLYQRAALSIRIGRRRR
jgi:GT2 family glycosyltransferase